MRIYETIPVSGMGVVIGVEDAELGGIADECRRYCGPGWFWFCQPTSAQAQLPIPLAYSPSVNVARPEVARIASVLGRAPF
jgi:hypothetical protein